MCLTAHYVYSNWKLHNEILNFCYLEPPRTSFVLCKITFELLRDWDIQHKVFSITLAMHLVMIECKMI